MKGGAHPSPFAALSFPDLNEVPSYFWDKVFQLPAGGIQISTCEPHSTHYCAGIVNAHDVQF